MATIKEIRSKINEAINYFHTHVGTKPVPACHFVNKVYDLCHDDSTFNLDDVDIGKELIVMKDSGMVTITKGPHGGVVRLMTEEQQYDYMGWAWAGGASMHHEVVTVLHTASSDPSPGQAINNHTCACGNTRCNKSEKTCWRCGNPL